MKELNKNRVYRSGESLLKQMAETVVLPNTIAIWHLGQEGMAVKGTKEIIYFDPYLTNYIDESGLAGPPGSWPREFPPPLLPEQVNNADYVFISHHHLDHLDPMTVGPMAKASPQAKFIVPAPHVNLLLECGIEKERIIPAKVNESLDLNGISVKAIPCKHEDYLLDENGDHGYLGYVVTINGIRFYHAGDTIGYTELPEILKPLSIEVACLPINGRDYARYRKGILGNLNHREAVDLAVEIGADLFIPIHYDLFVHNADNPAYLVDYLYRNYPGMKFKMMVPGERLIYVKEER